MPASKLPNNAIADAQDVIVYSDEITGREGSVLFATVVVPPIENRTGYTASKNGYIITAPANTFSESDVSNYFVFPGSPDSHYVITEYIDSTQVRTFTESTHTETEDCYLRGKTNLQEWHKIQKKWIFIWGQAIYVASWNLLELIRCRIISRDLPNNSVSSYSDFDDTSGDIFNSNGIFRIDFEPTIPLVYKINVPIPNIVIPDIAEEELSENNYHYLYSECRLTETLNLVNRLTPSKIEQETGTNTWDESYRDYSDIYTNDPIGNEEYTYGILTCGELVSPYNTYNGWRTIGRGSFRIGFDLGDPPWLFSDLTEIVVDFTNVQSMKDVAYAIRSSLRDIWDDATCQYIENKFIITTGKVERPTTRDPVGGNVSGYSDVTITYAYDGITPNTTNISDIMRGNFETGATLSTSYARTSIVIGPLYVSNVPNTVPQEYQWHLTHFPIYRTKDLLGRYKISDKPDQFNSPNDFIWTYDLRICGAFWGYISGIYYIAEQGEFEDADVGSTLELEDGSRYEILEYINSTTVRILSTGLYYGAFYSGMCAAAIGNGRVFRAYQTGSVVTRTRGDVFTSSDVRKPMKWATGYYSYIIEFISETQVRVNDDQDKTTMGMTIDPVYRYYNDTVSDNILDARLTRLKLKQRFWEPMPNGNVGKVTPGLVFVAKRGGGELAYGQIPDTLEYLHGYHDKGYQTTKAIADDIKCMWLFQDSLVIWTSRKTWRWPIASYQFITNPYTKDAILQIVGLDISDEDRGCFDWGSLEPIGDGFVMLLTSEPGRVCWRKYNGYQYGPNELEIQGKDRIPAIQNLQQATRAIYDGHSGMLLFGRE